MALLILCHALKKRVIGRARLLRFRMCWPKHLFTYRQGSLVERESFFVALLQLIEVSQRMEAFRNIRVPGSQRALKYFQSTLIEGRSLLVAASLLIQFGQVDEQLGHKWMLRA
jgi:hypothetical protein